MQKIDNTDVELLAGFIAPGIHYKTGYTARLAELPDDTTKSANWREGWQDCDNSIKEGEKA